MSDRAAAKEKGNGHAAAQGSISRVLMRGYYANTRLEAAFFTGRCRITKKIVQQN